MSGAKVPYQVRPNKYVERQLFIELLTHTGKITDLQNSVYISMGGRLLEDFKLVHSRLNLHKMMSIEIDAVTLGRQDFNCPLDLIDCRLMTSGDLVETFDDYIEEYKDASVIVWLDYAKASERGRQLSEFSTLISKLRAYDIAKITLNASLRTLGQENTTDRLNQQTKNMSFMEKQFSKLKGQIGDFLDEKLTPDDLNSLVFPNILSDAVGRAALNGNESDRSTFIEPLAAFVYNDGYHDMLTVSCIVLPYESLESTSHGAQQGEDPARAVLDVFNRQSGLNRWAFRANDWQDVRQIYIPDLSIKERHQIHDDLKRYKGDFAKVLKSLPFRVGDDEEDLTEETLKMYWKFYRYYPNFFHVAI
ncbi:hypothetical protein SAMN05444166_6950 [Singulisphaera sp. GP187]|uniref:O-methyltransferase n=1 Tax=Singulisphaera sp. GP187 TaxID=1882752 RepID=UPI00092B8ADC|nr:O-methyltransferase [Singulisphaera sp. GP187]SIO62111.1 hypothetical protein SAMN05444166_6950 [Singulisphaera sp. GP187]